MVNMVSIHLKDFDCWCVMVLKSVVELEFSTEGSSLPV